MQMGDVPGQLLEQVQALAAKGTKPEDLGMDGFPIFTADPLAPFHRQLNQYLREMPAEDRLFDYMCDVKPGSLKTGKALLAQPPEDLLQTLRAVLVRLLFKKKTQNDKGPLSLAGLASLFRLAIGKEDFSGNRILFRTLISELLRPELPFTVEDLATLVGMTADLPAGWWKQPISGEAVVRAVERAVARAELPASVRAELERWQEKLQNKKDLDSAGRKLLTRISLLLGPGADSGIERGEAWSNAALEDLKQGNSSRITAWTRLLQHCQRADSSKPTQKWARSASELVEWIGRDEFKSRVVKWFELVALPRPNPEPRSDPRYSPDPDQLITDTNSAILKGLVWSCAGWEDSTIARAISNLAQVCFKKVPNLGPRCPRIGNACLYALSVTRSQDSAAELSRLDQVVKPPSAKKLIGKSLNKAAELTGQSRADLEESTVPNYGLDAAGELKERFGEFSAEVCIFGPKAMEITWRKADGTIQKSVPTVVKENHADAFKKFKRILKDLDQMLAAQRIRIERLLLSERAWPFETWRERYLDHPLLRPLTRRLMWHFRQGDQTALGIWSSGQIVGLDDQPIPFLPTGGQTGKPSPAETNGVKSPIVRLWHPIGAEAETVASWRRWLEAHEVVQPFKQAHREIYILTDAEQRTGTYSNRFAAHVIKQHQFLALAKQRGWNGALQGAFDSHNTPTLLLPAWDLAAEFWVEGGGGGGETSPSGIFLYLSTDQVRFTSPAGEPRALSEVPALVFSEVMRDVDLFIGVCSIGNDAAWQDTGEAQGYTNYWRNYSFGDLSASAKTRKDVLARLIPKLRIASQCTLAEKFLIVKGSLRTYKIHLGSGNILMEPNDRYLCIVAGRSHGPVGKLGEPVFLPFEGDSTLSLILSKAFLLADDSKITDFGIRSQIR